jgi:hypothetical protein
VEMKYKTLDEALSNYKYNNMRRIAEDARNYIDAKLISDYDIANAFTFIKKYYFDEKIRAYKKEYTKEVFKFLIRELDYDGAAAKMLAKATPLPVDNKMGKIILSFGYGTFIGRINERHFDTFCFLSGIEKETVLKYTLWGEHVSNVLAGLQNGALYSAVSLIKKTAFGTELNPEEAFIVGITYSAIRSAYTLKDQREFKKNKKYEPYYWSWTTPSGAVFWTLSIYHDMKVKNKHTRFISKHFDNDTFLGRNFGEMKELHKYMKTPLTKNNN